MKKPSELCEACKAIYDSWNDITPETARAIRRSIGPRASINDLIRNTTHAVLESCTANHPVGDEAVKDRYINEVTQYHHED